MTIAEHTHFRYSSAILLLKGWSDSSGITSSGLHHQINI
uniref:Uncharacterized protein n=1 Tax=Tetranychus urticae TaxID=32264 RepID=T1KIC2_TETUR